MPGEGEAGASLSGAPGGSALDIGQACKSHMVLGTGFLGHLLSASPTRSGPCRVPSTMPHACRCLHWLEAGVLVWLCGADPGWGRHLSVQDQVPPQPWLPTGRPPPRTGLSPQPDSLGWGAKLARERRIWEGMVSCGSTLGGGLLVLRSPQRSPTG